MKIKLETSPWENDFEIIQDYIVAVKNCLDIDLDPANVATNKGKRAVAKICLTFWRRNYYFFILAHLYIKYE